MSDLEEIVGFISPPLKAMGYNKNKYTCTKICDSITIVFTIQKSAYTQEMWYYCFGICLNPLLGKSAGSISNCQIQDRLDRIYKGEHVWTAEEIVHLIERWEDLYGTFSKVQKKAIAGNLPPDSSANAIRYLTTVDLSMI